MKLTNTLLRWAKPLPKGHLWHGKYKLHKKVTPKILDEKRRAFELEERNMFYLRHPYLTEVSKNCKVVCIEVPNKFSEEQSKNHAKPFKHGERFIEKFKELKRNNWKNHSLLGDRFGFLKVAEKWE